MQKTRLIHPGFWFDKTPVSEALELARLGVGGFCLYGGTRTQVAEITKILREASPLPKILISADYEDGLGRWLPDTELLPSNLALGAAGEENFAFEKGLLTARQAKSLGVDWVFAPVVDLANNPENPIVNTRSFGAEIPLVIRLAKAFMKGMREGGVLNSLKHFPGHGDTATDSHLALPVLTKEEDFLRAREFVPFRELLSCADSIMAGHLLVPQIDKQHPASLSPRLLKNILREEWGYRGCILTDALLMKAIGDEKEAALAALSAGADILLVPEKPFDLIDFLNKKEIEEKILLRSEQAQNFLCAQVEKKENPSTEEVFIPTDFSARVAKKALTLTGNLFTLKPGETLHYLELGNDDRLSAQPFLQEIENSGIQTRPFRAEEPIEKLVILAFRQCQAFKGKINLSAEESMFLENAVKSARESVFISFASPWAARAVPAVKNLLLAYSPSPAFQQAAAKALTGKLQPVGMLPVSL